MLIGGIAVFAAVLVAAIVVLSSGDTGDDEASEIASDTTSSTTTPTTLPPPPRVDVPPGGFSAEQIGTHFGDAVWRIETSGCGIENGGSGFAISPTTS